MPYRIISADINNNIKDITVSEYETARTIAQTWGDLEALKMAVHNMGGGSPRRWHVTINGERFAGNYYE